MEDFDISFLFNLLSFTILIALVVLSFFLIVLF